MDTSPILVVEDDHLVRTFLCRALAGLGNEVDSCGNGADALEAVSRRRYGVVLLDGLLPDVHGVDLGRKLIGHVNGSGAGICFVSGTLRRSLNLPPECGNARIEGMDYQCTFTNPIYRIYQLREPGKN